MAKLSALADGERAACLRFPPGITDSRSLIARALGLDTTIVVLNQLRAQSRSIRRYPVRLIELGATYDDAERAAQDGTRKRRDIRFAVQRP
jgi:hypothetical protein